jgi:putative DNA primase/helicase
VAKIEMVLKWALKSEATPRMQAMIEQAHSEPGIAITHTQLDADPWLLNCVNGTVDLRTGTLRRPRRGDLLTKQTPVRYDPQARCPLWHAFLWRIMDGPRSDEAGDEQALLARHERAV